jgi:hypothetical protein
LSVAFKPAGTLVTLNWTVPAKPPTAVIVMVAALHWTWTTSSGLVVVLSVMLKSWTLTVTFAVWDKDPLVPATVTVYVPPVPVQLSALVPDPPVMLVGFRVHARPVAGEMLAVRLTAPVKPLTGMTLIVVDVVATPGVVFRVVGFAIIVKSTTWTVIVAVVCETDPLIPVTVTV